MVIPPWYEIRPTGCGGIEAVCAALVDALCAWGHDVTVFGAGTSIPGRPVLWLARFSPDKGPDLAIQPCRAAGLPLVLDGKCSEPREVEYFDEVIRPMLGEDTELILNADRPTTTALLTTARCLFMP